MLLLLAALEITERDKAETQEATASLAATKKTSTDAAALQELDGIFPLKRKKEEHWRLFLVEKIFSTKKLLSGRLRAVAVWFNRQ